MEEAEKKEGTDKILFFHGRTYMGIEDNRFTIAGTCYPNKIDMGIAICSFNDQFVKSKGRELALERLNKIYTKNGVMSFLLVVKAGNERQTFNRIASSLQLMTKQELVDIFNLHREE